jgi:hypothetical protein
MVVKRYGKSSLLPVRVRDDAGGCALRCAARVPLSGLQIRRASRDGRSRLGPPRTTEVPGPPSAGIGRRGRCAHWRCEKQKEIQSRANSLHQTFVGVLSDRART